MSDQGASAEAMGDKCRVRQVPTPSRHLLVFWEKSGFGVYMGSTDVSLALSYIGESSEKRLEMKLQFLGYVDGKYV